MNIRELIKKVDCMDIIEIIPSQFVQIKQQEPKPIYRGIVYEVPIEIWDKKIIYIKAMTDTDIFNNAFGYLLVEVQDDE